MKIIEKIRKSIVKALIRERDGYTFTGFSEGEPLKFYKQRKTGRYFVGMRGGTFYYAEPSLSGWCLHMSRHLDWSDERFGGEPVEVDFQDWMHGILDNIHDQYVLIAKSREESK
jgi:hypothetical protein